jgi:sugar transferase (PEP-CTERM/EpsH1 system associated)
MQDLLFLCHRIPYPPDKGDKIRAWQLVRFLAQRYRLRLGCFVDDPRDWQFAAMLRSLCAECQFVPLDPRLARLRALRGFVDGRPLTLPYYYDARLARWVGEKLRHPDLAAVFVYCSAMAQYVPQDLHRSKRSLADLVDVDSEKWFDYARSRSPLSSWVWQREGRKLRAVERRIAEDFGVTSVATEAECRLLQSIAPGAAARIVALPNGVDSDYFSPAHRYDRPPELTGTAIVFTGAMDYWPNADAAVYFARSILPRVREVIADARFFVVGANPTDEVRALTGDDGIVVTGRVPDVRPYIAHAAVVVAPLRIARGVQNKVLEGMAMAKPVVVSPQAAIGIAAESGRELIVADDEDAFVDAIRSIVSGGVAATIGTDARARVVKDYSWSSSLDRVDSLINA